MKPFSSLKPAPVTATALLAFALTAAASAVSAQGPGGPSPGHMQGQQAGEHPMQGDHHQSRRTARMVRMYDTNGDGEVSLTEINADQARMFTALDVDGDKFMSVDEIRRRGRSLQIFRTTTLFDLLDSNGDGKLSIAEVQAPSQRWFKRYDKNGNGIMEEDEIPVRNFHGRRGSRRR